MDHSTQVDSGRQVFVGLDYATAFVQVCALAPSGRVLANRRCENHWLALDAFVRQFGSVIRASIESCTGAANLADELIHRAGWSIDLAHPGYVHRMKQSPDKTDFSDARMLADLVRVGYLPRVWLAPESIRDLRRLVRHRQDLVDRRRVLKLKVAGWLRDLRIKEPKGTRWSIAWRNWLQTVELPPETRWVIDDACDEFDTIVRRMQRVESHMDDVTRDDPMVSKLRTLRGLGLITACVIRAEIGDATRFRTGKQLANYCALSPRNVSSGLRQADAGLIHAGNRYLRATLMEAAHRLRRFDPRWIRFSADMEARGKKRCVVVAAIANRWIRGLYHELKLVSHIAA